MKCVHPCSIAMIIASVLTAFLLLVSDDASAQVKAPKPPKTAPAPKAPKAAHEPKMPHAAKAVKLPKPSVQKRPAASVKPQATKQPEAQKTSDQQLVQAYRLIQSVQMTLKKADHDYGGHRAGAVKDAGEAEKQLREALKFRGDKPPAGKAEASATWHPEPQKLSNAQLAASVPAIRRTIESLKRNDHDYGGNRASAVQALQATLAQVEAALKYVK